MKWDPNLEYFRSASGYRNVASDHARMFESFRSFAMSGTPTSVAEPFVIQFVCHPNFLADQKEAVYYLFQEGGCVISSDSLPSGFQRANSYRNYKSAAGHPKGLFYEVNLYTSSGVSHHHTSRVSGNHFERDASHDQNFGTTKGKHWLS